MTHTSEAARGRTYTLHVVCRPSVRDGFALAGVHALPAVDAVEAAAVLRELVARAEPGVIFVEASLHEALPEALRASLHQRAVPIVIPFPGPRTGPQRSAEEELVEMLRVAIGHRVRLR